MARLNMMDLRCGSLYPAVPPLVGCRGLLGCPSQTGKPEKPATVTGEHDATGAMLRVAPSLCFPSLDCVRLRPVSADSLALWSGRHSAEASASRPRQLETR